MENKELYHYTNQDHQEFLDDNSYQEYLEYLYWEKKSEELDEYEEFLKTQN